jgi:tetratricopeptide (TPR) repeat protein
MRWRELPVATSKYEKNGIFLSGNRKYALKWFYHGYGDCIVTRMDQDYTRPAGLSVSTTSFKATVERYIRAWNNSACSRLEAEGDSFNNRYNEIGWMRGNYAKAARTYESAIRKAILLGDGQRELGLRIKAAGCWEDWGDSILAGSGDLNPLEFKMDSLEFKIIIKREKRRYEIALESFLRAVILIYDSGDGTFVQTMSRLMNKISQELKIYKNLATIERGPMLTFVNSFEIMEKKIQGLSGFMRTEDRGTE